MNHQIKSHKVSGTLVVVESLDGGGSGTVVTGLRTWSEDHNLKIFDLVAYWKSNRQDPPYVLMRDADVIISCEPTWVDDGLTLREIVLRDHTNRYSALETAKYFSRDRQRLFSKLLNYALDDGKIIFQERSFFSSLTYQIAHAKRSGHELTIPQVLSLDGNNYVSENYSPDLLIILRSDPKINQERLHKRDKQDGAWYEQESFQNAVQQEYESDAVREFIARKGITLKYIDTTEGKPEDTQAKACFAWNEFQQEQKINK